MGNNSVTWRLLPPAHGDPATELAAGTAMLAGLVITHQPALRWYAAGPQPALVIGSGQKLSEVDQLALRQQGVTLHRRASGGTAVLFVPGFSCKILPCHSTIPWRTPMLASRTVG